MKKLIIILVVLIAFFGGILGYAYMGGITDSVGTEIPSNEISTQKESEYYVYFYQPTCKYCILAKPAMTQFSEDETAAGKPVYIVDLSLSKNSKVFTSEEDFSDISGDNYKVIGTPTLIKVKDGKFERKVEMEEVFQMYPELRPE